VPAMDPFVDALDNGMIQRVHIQPDGVLTFLTNRVSHQVARREYQLLVSHRSDSL